MSAVRLSTKGGIDKNPELTNLEFINLEFINLEFGFLRISKFEIQKLYIPHLYALALNILRFIVDCRSGIHAPHIENSRARRHRWRKFPLPLPPGRNPRDLCIVIVILLTIIRTLSVRRQTTCWEKKKKCHISNVRNDRAPGFVSKSRHNRCFRIGKKRRVIDIVPDRYVIIMKYVHAYTLDWPCKCESFVYRKYFQRRIGICDEKRFSMRAVKKIKIIITFKIKIKTRTFADTDNHKKKKRNRFNKMFILSSSFWRTYTDHV